MLPEKFQEQMCRLLGAEYECFLQAYERPRNTGLRFNPLKSEPLPLPFCGDMIPWEPCGRYLTEASRPGLHPYHDAGVYYLQEPSAMAPARLLDARPGEWVLDLCAAPGGKSTQLAAAMKGRGLLVCNEIHPKRARILSSNLERLGVTNALVLNEHPAKLAERFAGQFDRILVDAPCSGEGMFRKEDAAAADWSPETVAMCAARQYEVLCSAAAMLKPGGRLVYSTCTFSPAENEGVVSRFLHSHDDFSVLTVDAPWFDRGRPEWIAEPAVGLEHTFRLWPHKLRGEGHYAAVLQRGSSAETAGRIACEPSVPMPAAAESFLRENGLPQDGTLLLFGESLYLAPHTLPSLRGLRVLRAGTALGEVRKNRFVPAHALAMACGNFPQRLSFSADSAEIAAYLHGETLPAALRGWAQVCVDGFPVGWAYGANGILKNHYPKGLRRCN